MRSRRVAGAALLGLGTLLLIASGVYYAYGAVAKSGLDRLSYSAERPSTADADDTGVPTYIDVPAAATEPASLLDVVGGEPQSQAQIASIEIPSGPARQTGDEVDFAGSDSAGLPELSRTEASRPVQEAPVDGQIGDAWPADGELAITGIAAPELFADDLAFVSAEDLPPAEFDSGSAVAKTESLTQSPGASESQQPDGDVIAAPVGDPTPLEVDAGSTVRRVSAETAADDESGGFAERYEEFQATFLAARLSGLTSRIDASKAEVATYSPPGPSDLIGASIPATRVRIPVIDVDSKVDGLRVLFLEDRYEWETPKNVVGHIPTTATPGDQGEGWYFGHLESLIKGEGNVFRRLPEIPGLAENYPIYVFLETADRKYVYQVYFTDVVHQDDLKITDSGKQDITLVTCTPRFYYDHRLLVTAALVGVSDA